MSDRERRLLIFDLDGTLIDSVHLVARVVNEQLQQTRGGGGGGSRWSNTADGLARGSVI